MAAAKKTPAKKAAKKAPRKRAAKKSLVTPDPAAMESLRSSMINYRLGNRTYAMVKDPKCIVCCHPGREQIEERIMFGDGYPIIAEWVSGKTSVRYDGTKEPWPDLTPKDLTKHYLAGHCPIDEKIRRNVEEQQLGIVDYEQLAGRLVDGISFAKQTVSRVQERVVRGEIEPSYREGLAAAKIITQAEQMAGQEDQNEIIEFYKQAFAVYFTTAHEIMSEAQWDRFSISLATNPVLQMLTQQTEPSPSVLDA